MMEQEPILKAFVKLGKFLQDFCENGNASTNSEFQDFQKAITRAEQQNGWFTQENIRFAIEQWALLLTEKQLEEWLASYDFGKGTKSKRVGVVMAGNIPLVGFHDFLCVLLSGNKVLAKLSSNDRVLLPFLIEILIDFEPKIKQRIALVDGKFEDFDAIIATGSNNTSRYFEYYFSKRPNIIRKNRNSVAVLSGKESKEKLVALGKDVFRYFGLGCRNVSKIYVPANYNFDALFQAFFKYKSIIEHHKYANNYDYNKAVYLMSEFKILDNGFLLLKKDESLSSPIATLFYEQYDNHETLFQSLGKQKEDIQCIVSEGLGDSHVPFGMTQKPELTEYADNVDTMAFLVSL